LRRKARFHGFQGVANDVTAVSLDEPLSFFGVLVPVAIAYVLVVELAKKWFFAHRRTSAALRGAA